MSTELLSSPPEGYMEWLSEIKEWIQSTQQKAVLAANSELIILYWQIGRDILERQGKQGWGSKVVDRLADDLRREFPEMKGFSSRNLKYMRLFAKTWVDRLFVQRVVAQIPWGHNLEILTKVKSRDEREWYARADIEYGWSRPVLVHKIESGLYHRQGKAVTNFDKQLPAQHSELAQQTLKDPYLFALLGVYPPFSAVKKRFKGSETADGRRTRRENRKMRKEFLV